MRFSEGLAYLSLLPAALATRPFLNEPDTAYVVIPVHHDEKKKKKERKKKGLKTVC
jgi:hypothetical protein